MCSKVFSFFIVLTALALAVMVTVCSQERMSEVLVVTRFFEAMIPVLGVGALLKYLCSRRACKNTCNNNNCCNK